MKATITKTLGILLCILLAAYVGYQIYITSYRPYQTEIVKQQHYMETVSLNGFFVRNEKTLGQKQSGVVGYQYKNGQKVPQNAVIASIYSQKSDLYQLRKIESLQNQINILKEIKSQGSSEGVQLDLLEGQISGDKMSLIQCVDDKNLQSIDSVSQQLMLDLDKYNSYVDKKTSYDGTIQSLQQQVTELKSEMTPVVGQVKTNVSGYFSSEADGYEADFTPSMLSNLTVSAVQKAVAGQKIRNVNSIAKVISDDTWHFVSLIDQKQADSFRVGRSVSLEFDSEGASGIPAVISDVIEEKGNDKAVVVFSGDYIDENLVSMRFEKPQVVLKDYTGIVIPKEAVRVRKVKDDKGVMTEREVVYTLIGKSVGYRLVEPVYEDDDILISKVMNGTDYVGIYDQVIVKGKGLADAAK